MNRARLSPLEIQAVVIAAGWAIWLLIGQPFASMAAFQVARLVDEWTWASAFLIGVAAQIAGYCTDYRQARKAGLYWIGALWLEMAGCILVASPQAPGIWTLWVLACSAIFAAANL